MHLRNMFKAKGGSAQWLGGARLAKYFGALHVRHTDRTEGHSRGAEASLESMHACDLASAEYKILW